MEMFDAILLNVLHKYNGCEAWLYVMVGGGEEGVGGQVGFVFAPGTLGCGTFIPQIVLIK